MSGLMEAIRRANQTRQPEDSLVLRAVVLGAVMTAALALVAESAVDIATGAALLVALPVAYWISYKRRRKDNWHIKIGLTIGAIFALFAFLQQLSGVGTLDEVRFPLATLFLWVQVLHGFDLPARKDLNFSLGSSLTLMAVAGSISQDLRIALFMLVYLGFVIAALTLSHRSEVNDRVAAWARVRRVGKPDAARKNLSLREVGRALIATALAGALMFLVIPQGTSARRIGLPFSVGDGLGAFGGGGIANPGFSGDPSSRSSSSSYYGFSDRMDLRVRGELSETLVMRVRSSAPAMWRAILFDRYDGVAWTGDSSEPEEMGESPPYAYPIEFRSLGPRQTISQTFYIEAEQANVIFTGGQPDVVYIQDALSIDDLGGLRTDSTLSPGTVYSVISTRGAATPGELRSLPSSAGSTAGTPPAIEPYLQLPPSLPARVEALARRITRDADNDYDRVKAIEAYMRENFRYSIDSPVPPPGRDAVDHFLFDTDVGFCEQFASATAVMLRTLGIPARVVAGYTPGDRNPFTGYHEVRASDAHSWVEVWFPRVGWYEFDPTFDVPPAHTELADMIPLTKVLRAIATVMAAVIPQGGLGSLRTGLAAALLVTAGAALWLARGRLRRRVSSRPLLDPRAGPVTRALARLEAAAQRSGKGRRPAETASEWLGRTSPERPSFALQVFEQERYGAVPPAEPDTRAAVEELDRLATP